MAKHVIVKFSADDIAINGKPLAEVRKEDLELSLTRARLEGVQNTKDLVADAEKMVERNIRSKRDGEKAILDTIIRSALGEAKKVSDYNVLLDTAAAIDEAEGSVILEKSDWEKVKDGFEKVKAEDRQPYWVKCREILKQLEIPTEYEEPKPEVKQEEDKKEKE